MNDDEKEFRREHGFPVNINGGESYGECILCGQEHAHFPDAPCPEPPASPHEPTPTYARKRTRPEYADSCSICHSDNCDC